MNFKLTLPSHCHFCRDELRRVPFRGFELVRILYGVRRYYCPHCFQIVPRAGGWLAVLLLPLSLLVRFLRWMLS